MTNKHLSVRFTLLPILIAVVSGMFTACAKTQAADACLELQNNCYSDGEFMLSQWGGHRWLVIPQDEQTQTFRSEFLLLDGDDCSLPEIVELLTADYGEPFARNEISPQLLSEKFFNPALFAMPNNRQLEEEEQLFWWNTDNYIIRLYEAPSVPELGLGANAVIALYDKKIL